jgi:hypothetical protein
MNKDQHKDVAADDLSQSLDDFSALSGEMPAEEAQDLMRIGQKISGELRRSRRRFLFMYALFSLIGYLASLSLCSQNSFMIRVFPLDIAVFLHQLPDPWCPLTCGLFFSALPISFLVFFLDRFQLRRTLRELWWLPIVTVVFACGLMTVLPESFQHEGMTHASHNELRDTRGDLAWLVWWSLAAVANPVFVIFADRMFAKLKVKRSLSA